MPATAAAPPTEQLDIGSKTTSVADASIHGRGVSAVLCLLTIFGPISMDLYLPVLPALTNELHTTTSAAQLTVTACLVGLALGQLLAGPISDRLGRRSPLLVGVAAYVVASLACAFSLSIEGLIAARFVQGLAGGVGIVIAQAAGRDLYSGGRLLRYYGRLTVMGGFAAIVGPVIGGQLARVTDWRGAFLFLAAVGVVILLASVAFLRETLPPARRQIGGVAASRRSYAQLLQDRVFLGAVLITGFGNAAIFAYLSGATFVLQDIYGLSPQGYSFAFGLNSFGFMAFGFLASRSAERLSVHGTLAAGIVICSFGAASLLLTALAALPLGAMILSLFLIVSGVAITTPPATTLALQQYPHMAGTAASVLGTARFAFGAVVAPLVGIAGAQTAVPLGIVTLVAIFCALLSYGLIRPRQGSAQPHLCLASA